MGNDTLRIGELGRATSTKVETVRYYERIGLLPKAPRLGSGKYRAYTHDHVRRLAFIRHARDLGFTLDQVRALLALSDQRQRSCDAVDAIAREHLVEVERKIASLTVLRRELTGLIGQCRKGTIAECRIVESLGSLKIDHRRACRSDGAAPAAVRRSLG